MNCPIVVSWKVPHCPRPTNREYGSTETTRLTCNLLADQVDSLAYNGLGCGSPLALVNNIQPSSGSNLLIAKSVLPEISSAYPGSKVTSFDMESVASGCYLPSRNGLLAPAVSCTIRFTGTKAVSGLDETLEFEFVVKKGLIGIALAPIPLQKKPFPTRFSGLRSLRAEILTTDVPVVDDLPIATASLVMDDAVYTAHVEE
jgi:hypothetical protein